MMVSSNAKRRSRLGDPKFQYLCGFPGPFLWYREQNLQKSCWFSYSKNRNAHTFRYTL